MSHDTTTSQPPKVLMWFKIYSGILCVLYLATAAASLFFFLADPADLDMPKAAGQLIGALILVVGLGLFAACLLPLILAPRPWL